MRRSAHGGPARCASCRGAGRRHGLAHQRARDCSASCRVRLNIAHARTLRSCTWPCMIVSGVGTDRGMHTTGRRPSTRIAIHVATGVAPSRRGASTFHNFQRGGGERAHDTSTSTSVISRYSHACTRSAHTTTCSCAGHLQQAARHGTTADVSGRLYYGRYICDLRVIYPCELYGLRVRCERSS